MAQALPFIAIAATVGGTAGSIQQQRKATRAAEKGDRINEAAQEISNQRSIRRNIVAARAQQAQLIASGQAASGGFGSSNIQGALGSAQSQAAANQGFANTQIAAGNSLNQTRQTQRDAIGRANAFGALAAAPAQFGFDTASVFKQFTDQSNANEGGTT